MKKYDQFILCDRILDEEAVSHYSLFHPTNEWTTHIQVMRCSEYHALKMFDEMMDAMRKTRTPGVLDLFQTMESDSGSLYVKRIRVYRGLGSIIGL